MSLRGRVALGLVCVAVLALVGPVASGAQEAFREVSLTPEVAVCPRYRLMVDDGGRTDCWLPGLTLAAADERPAGGVPPAGAVPATKEFSFIFGKLGFSDTAARLMAAGTAFTGGLVNEIADGFTKYGFS